MSKAIKVKELSKYINTLVKRDPILANLQVEGEVSNFKTSSGNVYFVLKDDGAALRCIVFKNMGLAKTISIKDGMKITARGSLTTYDYGSYYQLLVKEIVSDGIGDIFQQFELLKGKLLKEGLFNTEHKKAIKKMPNSIGVITSPTGAAIKDIINTIERRFPICDIYIYPSVVQGSDAPKSLIEGLKFFEDFKEVDTIIIGRGGGSFEDLNAFNDEELLYEIYNAKTPIISAVGHEVDNMLSDYVADLRAATPTAAAELATPLLDDLKEELNSGLVGLRKNYINYFTEERKLLDFYLKEIKYYDPKERIISLRKELDLAKDRLNNHQDNYYSKRKNELMSLNIRINLFNPISRIHKEREELKLNRKLLSMGIDNILNREKYLLKNYKSKLDIYDSQKILKHGYVKIYKNNMAIKSIDDIEIEDSINIFFKDGVVDATINNKESIIE